MSQQLNKNSTFSLSISSSFGRAAALPAALATLSLLAGSAFAQNGSRTWTGAVDDDFYNAGNWTGTAPTPPTIGFPNGNATFSGNNNTTILRTSNSYEYIFGLFFTNSAATDSAYTFDASGNKFFWGGSTIRTTAMAAGTLTDEIGVDLQLAGGNAGQVTKVFDIQTDHDLLVSGDVFGGNLTSFGGYSVTKTGDGTLEFSGSNSYTAETTVSNGTLLMSDASALGSTTGSTVVDSGATLEWNFSGTTSEAITINGSGVGGLGAIVSSGANNDMNSTLTLGSDAAIGGTQRIDHTGIIDDGGAGHTLTMVGPLNLVRSGAANFGHLDIDQGVYTMTGDSALPGGAGTSVTVGTGTRVETWANRTVSNAPNVIFESGSTMRNARNVNATASLNGTMDLSGGTVIFESWRTDTTVSSDISGAGGLLLRSIINGQANAQYTFSGNNTYTGDTQVGTGAAGVGIMTLIAGSSTAFGTNSAYTVTENSKLQLDGFSNSIGSLAGAGTVTNDNAAAATLTTGGNNTTTTFTGEIQDGAAGGALALTKVGTGTQVLDNQSGTDSSFTGDVMVVAGTLIINDDSTMATGDVTVGAGATLGGDGFVGGDTTVVSGGLLSPGGTAGGVNLGVDTLTFEMGLALDMGSITTFDLLTPMFNVGILASDIIAQDSAGNPTAAQGDGIDVGGLFTANGVIDLDFGSGYTPTWGDSWDLADFGSFSGTPTFTQNISLGSLRIDASNFANTGIITIIPEPSRVVLLGLGVIGFLLRRRR